jgi:predicted transglutaminase-like cysteine proteinase
MSLAAFVGLTPISCVAQPMFLTVKSTPYDDQMTRVRPILTSIGGHSTGRVSLMMVNQWMNELRAIPYGLSQQWKTPAEVESAPAADCKGKAIALYKKMRAIGARNVRLVIGKLRADGPRTHAWLEWKTSNGRYLLDPTFNWMAAKAMPGSRTYVPFYAYEGARKYRATNIALVARN